MILEVRFVSGINRGVSLILFLLIVMSSSGFLCAQEQIPENKVGQRFKQLLQILNEADSEKRR